MATTVKALSAKNCWWRPCDVIVKKLVEAHTHDDSATLSKVEVLGSVETVVTLRQHAKKLYKSVWFSQRVLHYPLTCKCSSSITKIIDKALTFFFSKLAWPACLLTCYVLKSFQYYLEIFALTNQFTEVLLNF